MASRAFVFAGIAAVFVTSAGVAMAENAAGNCAFLGDPDAPLERVPDCMRMGRHVRVDANVSRGTATLGEGMTAAGLRDSGYNRVRVPVDPVRSFFSGFIPQ